MTPDRRQLLALQTTDGSLESRMALAESPATTFVYDAIGKLRGGMADIPLDEIQREAEGLTTALLFQAGRLGLVSRELVADQEAGGDQVVINSMLREHLKAACVHTLAVVITKLRGVVEQPETQLYLLRDSADLVDNSDDPIPRIRIPSDGANALDSTPVTLRSNEEQELLASCAYLLAQKLAVRHVTDENVHRIADAIHYEGPRPVDLTTIRDLVAKLGFTSVWYTPEVQTDISSFEIHFIRFLTQELSLTVTNPISETEPVVGSLATQA